MEKLKKATKRITAVAASAVMVSSAAFAGGLGDYPNNFVKDGEFNAKVVVGAEADTIDTTAAMSLIEDLKAELTETSEKVVISYRKDSTSGTEANAIDADVFNVGDTLEDVAEDFDSGNDDVEDLFEDTDVEGYEYEQELVLKNGEFNYRIFDEVGDDEAAFGLFFGADEAFAEYTLSMTESPEVEGSDADEDMIGAELLIMGNEYTITEIGDDELTLVGGSNKIGMAEGDSVKTVVEGESYEVKILGIYEDSVQVKVGSETKSVDEFENEEIGGVNIVVTQLSYSGKEATTNYVEIVVGGQKIEMSGSTIEVNGEDVNDIHDDYDAEVSFATTGDDFFDGFTITYMVYDDTLLESGESLNDFLFETFALSYDGTNEPEYSEFTIDTSKDDIQFAGTMDNGDELPAELEATTDDVADAQIYLGSDKRRLFHQTSDMSFDVLDSAEYMDGITNDGTDVTFRVNATSSDATGNMFFDAKDTDEFYIYKITGVDRTDVELSFEELVEGKTYADVRVEDIAGDLELSGAGITVSANDTTVDLSALANMELLMENALLVDFAAIEDANFNSSNGVSLGFSYYASDVNMENASDEGFNFDVTFTRDDDEDKAIDMSVSAPGVGFEWVVDGEEEKDGGDYDIYMDAYGTIVRFDAEDQDDLTISVPEEELTGKVSLSFGDVAMVETVTVDADAKDAKIEELEDEGYTVVGSNTVTQEAVEFDVEGVTVDSDVTEAMDMIVVGGPAVNAVARELLGIETYTVDQAGVEADEGVIKYFEDENVVLVYGYEGEDTAAAVQKLNMGSLSGSEERVN